MKIIYYHPTLAKEIITTVEAIPYGITKQVNAIKLSEKETSKRDLNLNGLPVQLRMVYGTYKEIKYYNSKSAITIYRKLGLGVFAKTSNLRMRFSLAAQAVGKSTGDYFSSHSHLVSKASPITFDSYLEVCKKTNRFYVDIMNGKYEKGVHPSSHHSIHISLSCWIMLNDSSLDSVRAELLRTTIYTLLNTLTKTQFGVL